MIDIENMLTTRVILSEMDLLHIPVGDIERYVKRDISYSLAQEITKKVETTERIRIDTYRAEKEIEVRVFVLTPEKVKEINNEIKRLQKIEAAAIEATRNIMENI